MYAMRITDQDGTLLGVFSSEIITELLKESNEPEDQQLLQDIEGEGSTFYGSHYPRNTRLRRTRCA